MRYRQPIVRFWPQWNLAALAEGPDDRISAESMEELRLKAAVAGYEIDEDPIKHGGFLCVTYGARRLG